MAGYVEETSETLYLSDAVTGLSYALSVDTVALSETLNSHEEPVSFYESVTFSETTHGVYVNAVSLTDSVYYSDAISGVLRATSARSDTIALSDVIGSGLVGSWADTLISSELSATAATTNTGEVLVVSGVVTPRFAISGSFGDTLLAGDAISYGFIQSTVDSLLVSDSIAGVVAVASPVLVDTAVVSEVLVGAVAIYAALPTDTVEWSDVLIGGVALVGVLSDSVLLGDTLSDTAYQTLVVVNAETGATSTYTMTPTVAGLADYRGTLYLAGPDGLYAMDSDEDEEGKVVWTLRTGFSNLGIDLLKRVRDVNVQGRTEGGLTVQTITDRYGLKQEHAYLLPAMTRNSYRDGVVKVGRGVNSVYWALGLQGKGPAEVDQLRVAVEPLSRRR